MRKWFLVMDLWMDQLNEFQLAHTKNNKRSLRKQAMGSLYTNSISIQHSLGNRAFIREKNYDFDVE